jgi:peptide/nickel transport system substrate-binding protein
VAGPLSSPWSKVGAASVVAVLAAGCAGGAPAGAPGEAVAEQVQHVSSTPPATGPLENATWFMSKEPVTLDLDNSGATSQSSLIMANVCERLLQLQPDLTVQPHLASSYEWRTPTTLVFQIRPGVTFHDGAPLTADDVVWSLQQHAAEDSSEADEYVNVTGIEKTGDAEVTVTLSQPDAVLLEALAGDAGVVVQRATVEAQGADFGTPSGRDACSGPFTVGEWRSGEEVVLRKAADYWNPERAAKTDEVTFRWAADDAIVNSLTTGAATGAYLETISSATQLVGGTTTTVSQGPDTRVWNLMVTERGGLTDVRLRQALSLALNRDGISRAGFAGLAPPWSEPVGSGAWGYERERFEAAHAELRGSPANPSDADLQAARDLVAQVGATEPIVVATDGSAIRNVLAGAVVDAAGKIGLEASQIQIPTAQYSGYYASAELRGQADLFADDYFISKNDPVGFYKNGASDSTVQWVLDDPEFDALIQQGRAALDDGARADTAIEMAKRWEAAMPWIPAVLSPNTLALASGATGVPASGCYRYYPWAADLGAAGP